MLIYSGCDISPKAVIGKNISLPHPLGIVIGEKVTIGDNVKIWQHVTLGSTGKRDKEFTYPVIGNNVRIFTGATIIGNVKIGDHATIGAHALVLTDVPKGATAIGSPAKLLQKTIP